MTVFKFCKSSNPGKAARKIRMPRVALWTLVILLTRWLPGNADPSRTHYTYKRGKRIVSLVKEATRLIEAVDILPELYRNLHPWMRPLFSSSLTLSTLLAIVLTQVFRIGPGKPRADSFP